MQFFDLNLNSGWKISQSLLLITINSHVINDSWKRLKDQSLTKKGKGERRLHTGIRFQNEETRRVSEQTPPPGGTRSWASRKGKCRRIEQ